MDNNMNSVDYNNIESNNQQTPNNNIEAQTIPEQQFPNSIGPQMSEQSIPNNIGVQSIPQQPVLNSVEPQSMTGQQFVNNDGLQMPQQSMDSNMGFQMPQQPMNQGMPGDVPVINIEQSPTEVFGQQVNNGQPNDPTRMNQMLDSINMQQQPEAPKYGYTTNEQKPDLNADSNVNLKVIIFIAVIILGFIIALPYLSNLLDK